MSGLLLVGKTPANPTDVVNRLAVTTALNAAVPNRAGVTAQAASTATSYGAKTYIDTQDAAFQLPSYYTTQDALNVALTSVGQPNGVAALDASSKALVAQLPVIGAGYLQGPYGVTATFTGTTSAVPMKIADFNLGAAGVTFHPLVFMACFVTGSGAQPVIEVRIANSTTAVSYAAGTLVAKGVGRSFYDDYHAVMVTPSPATTGQSYPTALGPTYNVWLSAWLYDQNNSSVTIASGNVASGAAFYQRTAQ